MRKNSVWLFSCLVIVFFGIFSCQQVVQQTKNLEGSYTGFINSEYVVKTANGETIKGSSEIKFFEFQIKKYDKNIMYYFLPEETKKVLDETGYIFNSDAEFKGETQQFNKENVLINDYTLVKEKEIIKIIGGFIKNEEKIWLVSNTSVQAKTKEGITLEIPSLELGFYPPSNTFPSYQAFLIKYNLSEDKIIINDVKVLVGSFGKANIKISGEFVRK
jgi:hypothetical protein